MPESPVTRASLLLRIRDGQDHAAWNEFVDRYAGLIYGFARKRGLQDADARDLIQTTLIKVVHVARGDRFDPSIGSFDAYLFRIAQNNLRDFFRSRGNRMRGVGGADDRLLLEEVPDRAEDEIARREDHEHTLARAQKVRAAAWCVRRDVRPKEWEAFWMTCVEGRPVAAVAKKLAQATTVWRTTASSMRLGG